MACKPVCRLCDKIRISSSVTFTGGNLVVNIPAGSYNNCQKICLIIAQTIPATTTINAPVFITIGSGSVLYPLVKCNCQQVTACSIRTRTKYSMQIVTTPTSGSFRLLGNVCPCPTNNLTAINGTAPVVATEEEPTTPTV